MIKGGKGGGNTITGINFERERDLGAVFASLPGYKVEEAKVGFTIYFKDKEVARSFRKYSFYKFLAEKGLDYKKYISKRLVPDDAIYVILNNVLYIIEMKVQNVTGSVDEKLQTCDFKKKQYKKLMSALNIDVEYIYILSDWFKKPEYKDVLDYIISVGCQYYFEYLPFKKLGLPVPIIK